MTLLTDRRKQKSGRRKRPDKEMVALEAAAEAKDERAFWLAFNQINWEKRAPEAFVQAVELALMAGAYQTARWLAEKGNRRFPGNPRLEKLDYVLAPPHARSVSSQNRDAWQANRQGLRANRQDYKGKWVAIHNGKLLAVGDSPAEITAQIGEIKGRDILLTVL